jgi:hypothetical protein
MFWVSPYIFRAGKSQDQRGSGLASSLCLAWAGVLGRGGVPAGSRRIRVLANQDCRRAVPAAVPRHGERAISAVLAASLQKICRAEIHSNTCDKRRARSRTAGSRRTGHETSCRAGPTASPQTQSYSGRAQLARRAGPGDVPSRCSACQPRLCRLDAVRAV